MEPEDTWRKFTQSSECQEEAESMPMRAQLEKEGSTGPQACPQRLGEGRTGPVHGTAVVGFLPIMCQHAADKRYSLKLQHP